MEEDIFKKYDELFCPPKIKELDIELDKLDNQTKMNEKFNSICDAFDEAEKLNFIVKRKMKTKKKEFIEKYDKLIEDFKLKKIFPITEFTQELQNNMGEYSIPARTRGKFGRKINMVISTSEYGTNIGFPSLAYFTPQEFNEEYSGSKEIKFQLFRIQYVDKITECFEQYKKIIAPKIELMNKYFDEVKLENSKYFVIGMIGNDKPKEEY